MLEIIIVIIVILVFIGLVYAIEHQAKTYDPLRPGKAAFGFRLLALVLGLVALGFSIFELTTSSIIGIEFPIITIVLLGYAFGAGLLSKGRQGTEVREHNRPIEVPLPFVENERTSPKTETLGATLFSDQFVRFVFRWVRIITLLAIAIYAALWAYSYPDSPIAAAIVIGFVLVFVLARVGHVFRILKK